MSVTLTVRDEMTFAFGGEEREFTLDFPAEKVTVRDLLRARVYGEVEEFNARRSGLFRGLVQPTDTERVLKRLQGARGAAHRRGGAVRQGSGGVRTQRVLAAGGRPSGG